MTEPKPPAPSVDEAFKELQKLYGRVQWKYYRPYLERFLTLAAQPSPSVERREEIVVKAARIIDPGAFGHISVRNGKEVDEWVNPARHDDAIDRARQILALAQPATGAVEEKS